MQNELKTVKELCEEHEVDKENIQDFDKLMENAKLFGQVFDQIVQN